MWLESCESGHQKHPASDNGPKAAAGLLARQNPLEPQTPKDRGAAVPFDGEGPSAFHRFQRLATVPSDVIQFLDPRRLMRGAHNNRLLYRQPLCKQSTAEMSWNRVPPGLWDAGGGRRGLRNGFRKETKCPERSQNENQCFSFGHIDDGWRVLGITFQEPFELLETACAARSWESFPMDDNDAPPAEAWVCVNFRDEILSSLSHQTLPLEGNISQESLEGKQERGW